MRRSVITCNRCGKSAPAAQGDEPARCPHCGGTVNLTFTYTSSKERDFGPHPNRTPLRPGMKAVMLGREYELTGRAVMSVEEEGEVSYWDEFLLISKDGHMLYLELDEGQWKVLEPFTPPSAAPMTPGQIPPVGSTLRLGDKNAHVIDANIARVEAVQGHFPYEIAVGDRSMYADARTRNNVLYCIEWTDETEYYRGRPLTEREVYTYFGLKDAILALDRRAVQGKSQRGFGCVLLLLAIVSFIVYGASLGGGQVISRNAVPLETVGPDGMRFGPITLDPNRRIHRLIITGTMNEASAWVAGVLESADGKELIGSQGDFWDESGYDEGYWHESDLRAQTDFVAQNPGPYFVHLYVEKDPSRGSFGTAGYELHAGVMYPTYLLVFGIFALIAAFIFFCLGSREALAKAAANAESD